MRLHRQGENGPFTELLEKIEISKQRLKQELSKRSKSKREAERLRRKAGRLTRVNPSKAVVLDSKTAKVIIISARTRQIVRAIERLPKKSTPSIFGLKHNRRLLYSLFAGFP